LTTAGTATALHDDVWRWRAYPNESRAIHFEGDREWLLVAFPEDRVPSDLHKLVAAHGDGALLADLRRPVEGRHAVRIAGVDRAGLRALADALEALGVVDAAWPALRRAGGVGFTDDALVLRIRGAVDHTLRDRLATASVSLGEETRLPGVWRAVALDGDGIGAARRLGTPAWKSDVQWAEPDLIRVVETYQDVPDAAAPLADAGVDAGGEDAARLDAEAPAPDAEAPAPDADAPAPDAAGPPPLPDDPEIPAQWHLWNDTGVGHISAPGAWAITQGSLDTVIGIFDTGTDMDHPDLLANITGGLDALGADDDPEAECGGSPDGAGPAPSCPGNRPFRESHGTAVSGVAAAVGGNDLLGSGVCPRCGIWPVRLIGSSDGFRSIEGAEAFRAAADDGGTAVINNSWGPSLTRFFPLSTAERETFRYLAFEAREGRGVVLVFAAGNDFFTPASSNPYAAYPHVVTVSASTRIDDFACYSNYGDVIDIAAPSRGCYRGEDGIVTTDYVGREGYSPTEFTNSFGGTSAASPVVAGAAGLVLAANPALTAQQVKLLLQVTADKITADKNDWEREIGQPLTEEFAYDERGFSQGFGFGRLNAERAVEAALDPEASLGLVGGPCGEDCPRCVNNRCAPECEDDMDCPAGSRCQAIRGGNICRIPEPAPTDPGEPCDAECDACISTVDSRFAATEVCTVSCETDDDCPFGFDCRAMGDGEDAEPSRLCIPGNAECGERWGETRCQSGVRVDAGGQSFCSCECLQGGAGACPDGFECSWVACERAGGGLRCVGVESQRQANQIPHCVPGPDFRVVCETHRDCAAGLWCIDGECAVDSDPEGCDVCAPCNGDDDCGAGAFCDRLPGMGSSRCFRECDGDADCPGDSECFDLPGPDPSICVNPESRSKGYCPQAYRCYVDGRCFGDDDCFGDGPCEARVCAGRAMEPDAAVEVPEEDAGPEPPVAADAGADAPVDAATDETDAAADDDGERGRSRSSGCDVAPSDSGRGTPLEALLLVLLAAARRRR
jgi:subtilisin family serine protease